MSLRALTIDQLRVSEHNVRTNEAAINETGAIEDSIVERGLIFPLVVHPLADGLFGVLDGGRRCRSIRKLVDSGRLPADWPIECVVREGLPAEITEMSLMAFLLARDLMPYEVHAAVATAHAQGASVDDIARNLGQDTRWVRQQLRLGRLAPEIFAAYAEGKISIDIARAYAATEDQALQRLAFEHFRALSPHAQTDRSVHRFFKVGDRELEQLLHFVGDGVYRAAGGRFELDLFADGPKERGRVVDEGKLRELADNAIGLLKHDLRRRTRRSDLRFVPEAPRRDGREDIALEIRPGKRGDRLNLPDGDIVATIDIDGDGEPVTRWWWASRKAKSASERPAAKPAPAASDRGGNYRPEARIPVDRPAFRAGIGFDDAASPGEAQRARALVRDEHGLSTTGLHVVRSLRRELLRALLVEDTSTGGELGRDYIVWAQLREALGDGRSETTGALGLRSHRLNVDELEPPEARSQVEATTANTIWSKALEAVSVQRFIIEPDPTVSLGLFVQATEHMKRLAGAVLAGLALLRSANTEGFSIAVHDRLADLAGGSDDAIRTLWSPEPEFLALFPKAQRVSIAEPLFGPGVIASWSKLGDADLARTAATALAGNPLSAQPLRWVHPLLSFGVRAKEVV